MSYWSPLGSDTEVDFVIERGKEKIAIEVKTARNPGAPHLKGLRAISGLRGLKRRILVYPGTIDRTTDDKIEILSIRTFIDKLASGLK